MTCNQQNSGTITLKVGQACNVGMVRSVNEDSILVLNLTPDQSLADKKASLFAVADGMGGCQGGEIASSLAIKVLGDHISDSLGKQLSYEDIAGLDSESIQGMLMDAILAANHDVFEQRQSHGNDMGTTLVAALVIGTRVYIANVGDSRAYSLEENKLRQITNDHSLVAAMVSAGLITQDNIYTHPQRNVIIRSLGVRPEVDIDIFTEHFKAGNSVLLCSDGLWEMVRDQQIRDVLLASPDPQTACDALVSMANQNGGSDNISIIVAELTEGSA